MTLFFLIVFSSFLFHSSTTLLCSSDHLGKHLVQKDLQLHLQNQGLLSRTLFCLPVICFVFQWTKTKTIIFNISVLLSHCVSHLLRLVWTSVYLWTGEIDSIIVLDFLNVTPGLVLLWHSLVFNNTRLKWHQKWWLLLIFMSEWCGGVLLNWTYWEARISWWYTESAKLSNSIVETRLWMLETIFWKKEY